MLINGNAARIVDRYLGFREGTAYGIDQLLEPPGLGAHCDMLENRTTYVSGARSRQKERGFLGFCADPELPLPPCLRAAVDHAKDFPRAPTHTTTR